MKRWIDTSHRIEEYTRKCIIGFDIWGTLLKLDKVLEYIAVILADEIGVDKDHAVRKVFRVHDEARKLRRLNPDLSVDELVKLSGKLIEETFNTSIATVERAIQRAFSWIGNDVLYDDTIPALVSIRSRGIKMGVIGNVLFWGSIYTRNLLEKFGLRGFFDEMIFSDELGVSKPDRRIFLELARKMNIEPNKLIYVGDNIVEDLGGALAAGAFGVLIRRDLNYFLVLRDLRVAVINRLTDLINLYELLCI